MISRSKQTSANVKLWLQGQNETVIVVSTSYIDLPGPLCDDDFLNVCIDLIVIKRRRKNDGRSFMLVGADW